MSTEQIYIECGVCGNGQLPDHAWLIDKTERNLELIRRKRMACPKCNSRRVRVMQNPEEQRGLREGEKDAMIASLRGENARLHELLRKAKVKPEVVSQLEAAEAEKDKADDADRPKAGKAVVTAGRRGN